MSSELQPHAGRAVGAEQARRVADVDQRQRAVVLEVTRLEHAHHLELAQPRHHPGRRHVALRRDQRHPVADAHRQRARQFAAEHDVELAIDQGADIARRRLGDIRHGRLGHRVDAADQRTPHDVVAREHALRVDERRGGDDARVFLGLVGHALPVVQSAPAKAVTSTCDSTESMRSRTSLVKPFITDSTMISAATPSAMPAIEIAEMNEMKALRRRARRPARV
jgi:hypothetical protein